jgi:hypothetical protein
MTNVWYWKINEMNLNGGELTNQDTYKDKERQRAEVHA